MSDWPIDWLATVDEAIRRRKAEGLSQRSLAALAGVSVPTVNAFEQGEINLRFERVTAILSALGMFAQPGRKDSFEAFIHNARRRWDELVAPLPSNHASRQSLGHSEQAYAIVGLDQTPSTGQLREILSSLPESSGWPPFWVPTRPELHPIIEDGTVECWLGRPSDDRLFNDPAHSDFWQVTRHPFAFLRRGYQEDGPDNLEPGTVFDLILPIWRTAEFCMHAANFARRLGAEDETEIRFMGRYFGLEGRTLLSWARPLLHTTLDRRHRARSYKAELVTVTQLGQIEGNLEIVISEYVAPLYERFDGYQLSTDLIAAQLTEMRRQTGFGVGGD